MRRKTDHEIRTHNNEQIQRHESKETPKHWNIFNKSLQHNVRRDITGHSKSEGPLFENLDELQQPQMRFQIVSLIVILLLLPLSLSLKHTHTHTYIYIHTYIHTYIYISIFAQQNFSQNQLLLKPNLKFKIPNTSDYYCSTMPDAI